MLEYFITDQMHIVLHDKNKLMNRLLLGSAVRLWIMGV